MNTLRVVIIIFFATLSSNVLAKPKNFDECILENIAATSTAAAVAAITRACRNLYPSETSNKKAEEKKQPVKKQPLYRVISLRKNDTEFVDIFGKRMFRVHVTNESKYKVYGYWDYETRVWVEYRVVGCGDNPATKAETKKIQRALNNRKFLVGKPDGILGPKTIAALKRFQQSEGLVKSGEINRITAERLGVSLGAFDPTRKVTVGGSIPGNSINPRESRYVDFEYSSFIPKGECFYSGVKAKVQIN